MTAHPTGNPCSILEAILKVWTYINHILLGEGTSGSLAGDRQKPHWTRWVWSKTTHPKHKIIAWLIYQRRLKTRSFLHRFLDIEDKCGLCGKEAETINHLFLECKITAVLRETVFDAFGIKLKSAMLLDDIERELQNIKTKRKRSITTAVLAANWYNIWKMRNAKIHGKEFSVEAAIKNTMFFVKSFSLYNLK
ncbi:unnamed protein product [Cuscuta campestris]|uniref:Reverse transcriptase zinc-binding domain-containing protein n=1 Tax=Cuscuta campestris TaxID=132261 RepID=A0A484K203_9ASTE|nr:unnamed protein product [Cuscuta campestris]